MKSLILFVCAGLLFLSCKKSTFSGKRINAMVFAKGGATPNSYQVIIDTTESSDFNFLCKPGPIVPAGVNSCRNTIYITNLPPSLQSNGTYITFSRYKDLGRHAIWSSTYAPNDVEVYDAERK